MALNLLRANNKGTANKLSLCCVWKLFRLPVLGCRCDHSRMQASLVGFVRSHILQNVVDRVFKTGASFVGDADAFRDELTNLKTIHTLCKSTMD